MSGLRTRCGPIGSLVRVLGGGEIGEKLDIDGVAVEVVRKDVKHLRIAVYAADGRVRVSVPRRLGEAAIRRALKARLPWIRAKQAEFGRLHREPLPEFVSGERHLFEGRLHTLRVEERAGRPSVRLGEDATIVLSVPPGADRDKRARVLDGWYRRQLGERAAALTHKWEGKVGASVAEVRIRQMKTRWGSCNTTQRRIWLNLELMKKPAECLEYVMVHEMAHLHECNHGPRFHALMDSLLPPWRRLRAELNGRSR